MGRQQGWALITREYKQLLWTYAVDDPLRRRWKPRGAIPCYAPTGDSWIELTTDGEQMWVANRSTLQADQPTYRRRHLPSSSLASTKSAVVKPSVNFSIAPLSTSLPCSALP